MNRTQWKYLWQILFSPSTTWQKIEADTDTKAYRQQYYYPLVGILALSAMMQVFIQADGYPFAQLIGKAFVAIVLILLSYGIGFYIAQWLLNLGFSSFFGLESDRTKAGKLYVYAITPVLLVRTMTSLLQDLFFLYIFSVYIVYLLWLAAGQLYRLDEKMQSRFTFFSTMVILLSPMLVELFLKILLPVLK